MQRFRDRQPSLYHAAVSLGLVCAFWPTWIDLFEHYQAHPWTRASLVFPGLAWLAARSEPGPVHAAGWGWGLLGFGLLLELAAIAGGYLRLGRLGLGLAAFGICRGAGWTSTAVGALLLWSIPVPHALIALASPTLEGFGSSVAVSVTGLLGLPVEAGPDGWSTQAGLVELLPIDGGLVLVAMGMGLAWFLALRDDRPARSKLPATLVLALAGLPVQLVVLAAAATAAGMGASPATIRNSLDSGPWLLTWTVAFWLVWRTRRATRGSELSR